LQAEPEGFPDKMKYRTCQKHLPAYLKKTLESLEFQAATWVNIRKNDQALMPVLPDT
jgi:hypothetical protein